MRPKALKKITTKKYPRLSNSPAVEKDEELGLSSKIRAVFIGEHAEKRFLFHKLSVDSFDLPLVAVREDGHDDHVGLRMVLLGKSRSGQLHFSSGQVQLKSYLKS